MKIETFDLERWMTTYEVNVDYDIAESGIYPMSVRELLDFEDAERREETLNRLLDNRLGYSEAPGSLELRSLLAATYRDSGPDNILITTGAIEANFLLFNVLLEPGDHVVAIYPAYQQLYSVPRAIGCDVSLWKLRPEDDFRFDLDELERLVQPNTRMIVINTPHNPTGSVLSPDEVQQVYDLAQSVGARVMSDEAYRWLDLPGGEALSGPARDLGDGAVSVGTFSKPFGLPGLRIGWISAPADVVAESWAMRDYISLSPGKLNDALAVLAFRHREKIRERTHEIVSQNLQTMDAWLTEHRDILRWTAPRGGLLALLEYDLDIPSMQLANRLAEEYSVMLAPGSAFGYEYRLRVGVGQTPDVFRAGLERASACFADLQASGVGRRDR
jgi:aspartate/methionine/tyrosine aminotransferase